MHRQVVGRERIAGWLRALALSSALVAGPALADANPGEAPIHQLARAGSGADIERALAADPQARDLKSALGSTPLHLAAMNPDTSALKALVRAGADPNARNGDGSTPLHMAAYASRPEHAQLLLEAGADPLARNDGGRDAAAMARKVKSDEAAGIISLWILKGCKAGTPC